MSTFHSIPRYVAPFLLAILCALIGWSLGDADVAQAQASTYEENIVLTQFIDGLDDQARADTIKACKGLPQHSALIPYTSIWRVAVPPGQAGDVVLCLNSHPNVLFAELDAIGELDGEKPGKGKGRPGHNEDSGKPGKGKGRPG